MDLEDASVDDFEAIPRTFFFHISRDMWQKIHQTRMLCRLYYLRNYAQYPS
jgi:hypothetical protein